MRRRRQITGLVLGLLFVSTEPDVDQKKAMLHNIFAKRSTLCQEVDVVAFERRRAPACHKAKNRVLQFAIGRRPCRLLVR